MLRALLKQPQKKWVIPELCREGLSGGLASGVLNRAEALGYLHRERKGRESYSRIARKELLLKDGEVTQWLSKKELEGCFSVEPYLKHVPSVFQRLGLRR